MEGHLTKKREAEPPTSGVGLLNGVLGCKKRTRRAVFLILSVAFALVLVIVSILLAVNYLDAAVVR